MKELIDTNKCKFLIEVMPHQQAHGLFLIRENYPKHLLMQSWTPSECKDWIFSHFTCEKGKHFDIEIKAGKVVENKGLLHLEYKEE